MNFIHLYRSHQDIPALSDCFLDMDIQEALVLVCQDGQITDAKLNSPGTCVTPRNLRDAQGRHKGLALTSLLLLEKELKYGIHKQASSSASLQTSGRLSLFAPEPKGQPLT